MLTSYFYHKVTWVPWTWLTAKVTLVNANNDTKILDNVPLTELTSMSGAYVYNYTLDTDTDYIAYFTCTDTNYLPKVDKIYIPKQVWWYLWWNRSSQYDFNATDRDNIQKILERVISIDEKEIDFTDLYKKLDDAISKIESIEIPDIEEKEAKKAVKLLDSVSKELKTYIQSQNKKEDEIMAITSELNKLDMEDAMEEKKKEMEHKQEMERKKKEEEEENKKIVELLNAEFDKMEEEDRIEKKKELEKELEEMDKEMKEIEMEKKEIQKELKSL